MKRKTNKLLAKEIINREIAALKRTVNLINNDFERACDILLENKGKVIVLGLGKSSFIAMKMAATLSSTGTSALFLHPADALHGDVGVIEKNDTVVIFSNSGETEEIIKLLPLLKILKCSLISITGNIKSTLAKYSKVYLNSSVLREACPNNLAPTSSIVCALAISDALALAVSSQNNFTVKDFAKTHPEGAIGKRLLITVAKIMDKKHIPLIDQNSSFSSLLDITIKSNFGLAIIINSRKHIIGVISDGDIKRIMKEKKNIDSIIIKQVMSKKPVVINQDMLAVEALSVLEENNVDAAPVVDSKQVIGVLTLKKVIKSIN